MRLFNCLMSRWISFLRNSPHLHLRQGEVDSLLEVVLLFDKFLFGPVDYPLQWDDFISWQHENARVEEIRNRIGEFEHLLFSGDPHDRRRYREIVLAERNRLAAQLGMPPRAEGPVVKP